MSVRSILFCAGLVPFALAACGQQTQGPRGLSNQDKAALQAIADRDTLLVRARDWAALTAEYTENAVRMPPNGPTVQGRDAIRKFLEQTPPLAAFEFHLVDLDGDGDVAFMRANFSMTFTLPGTTKPVSDSGKILVVLLKQADGAWLRVADAWNSNLSPSK